MNNLYNTLHNKISDFRDRYTPARHTSTFRSTGQITPEEFLLAGDYLVYKFPSWSWSDASHPSKRLTFLPEGKQFLVTRGVPCHRRLNENFAGDAGIEDQLIKDALGGAGEGDDDGWLRTGAAGMAESQEQRAREVRTVDESGRLGELSQDEEEEIPDMEDEEDDEEAIIRDTKSGGDTTRFARASTQRFRSCRLTPRSKTRTYNIYITYSSYWRTPRLYLSGYNAQSEPLAPQAMMEDIVGDYKDKTVTLDDFPYMEAGVKMASIHPCKHASVMKVLLDRADAALKLRMARGPGSQGARERCRSGRRLGRRHDRHGGPRGSCAVVEPHRQWREQGQRRRGVGGAGVGTRGRGIRDSRRPVSDCLSQVHRQRHTRYRARLHNGHITMPHGLILAFGSGPNTFRHVIGE